MLLGRRHKMARLQELDEHSMDKKPGYRKHVRLRHFDYRQDGYYFVTLCTAKRQLLFSSKEAESLVLSRLQQIPRFLSGVSVDLAVVMPNHLHAILVFEKSHSSLGQAVQVFKSWVTRELGQGKSIWQPNYYEHVVRSEKALFRIRKYIQNNPLAEDIDCEQFYSS